MSARRWLIDLPARIVDLWFMAYHFIILVATILSVTVVVVMLVLAAFGIRWGW